MRLTALFSSATLMLAFTAPIMAQRVNLHGNSHELNSVTDARLDPADTEAWPQFGDQRFGVVGVPTSLNAEARKNLADQGVSILEFLPPKSYLLAVRQGASFQMAATAQSGFSASMKPALHWADAPSHALTTNGLAIISLFPFTSVSLDDAAEALANAELTVVKINAGTRTLECVVSEAQMAEIAALSFVQHFDWLAPIGQPENYTGRTLHRVNSIGPPVVGHGGLNGKGINVMVQDDGFIGPHIDYEGRITEQFWSSGTGAADNHGDHVAGTVAGAGNLNPYHAGNAPGANLFIYKAAPEYQGFDSITAHYSSRGITITSTSYSDGCNAGYTTRTRQLDEQAFDMPNLLHVFSAGNNGASGCGYTTDGSAWGNITGGHKAGKNVLAVANVDSYGVAAGSSSRGPAHDGRLKPEVSAKGSSVTSTIADNQYDTYSGTSMACPGVSGVSAVLYQAFDSLYDSLPTSAVIKSLLMNTADDVGNTGPDFIYGYGIVNAQKAFKTMQNGWIEQSAIGENDTVEFNISVGSGVSELRAMVYWIDPEASVSASTALVNDLDLVVIDGAQTTYSPWVLNASPNNTALSQPATTGADHLNNVEQVIIEAPGTGSYTIRITGYNVPMGPQNFVVVYWLEEDEVTLDYPIGGERIETNSSQIIRWSAPASVGNVSVQYSLNGGASWSTVSSAVAGGQGWANWNVPTTQSGLAMVRISAGSVNYDSDTFSIMTVPQNLTFSYSCPTETGLSWDVVAGAQHYLVYELGDKYMEVIGQPTTNNFVHSVNAYQQNLWYSVAAAGPDGAISPRAIAVQKPNGLSNCVLSIDAALSQSSPASGSVRSCFGDSVNLRAKIVNHGVAAIGTVTIIGRSSSDSVSTIETVNLQPFDSVWVEFLEPLHVAVGAQTVSLIVETAGEQNPYNDTLIVHYNVMNDEGASPLWQESFDGFDACETTDNCGTTTCLTINGWVNEANGQADDADWRIVSVPTPSTGTGPSADHTSGFGNYLYTEASGDCYGMEHLLTSPCIDLSAATEPYATFWYHMQGANMGTLSVDVFDGSTWHEGLWELSGQQNSNWEMATVLLHDFAGQMIVLRFRGTTGSNYQSDMAIDDIGIWHLPIARFSFSPSGASTALFTDQSLFADSLWFDAGDGTTMDSMPSSHTYANNNSYFATQIASNFLGSDTFTLLINTLKLSEPGAGALRLFPSPATDLVCLQSSEAMQIVQVFSMDGRLVAEVKPNEPKMAWLEVSQLATGCYSVVIDSRQRAALIVAR